MKRFFNFDLYREALRQQRLVGWMSFLILALESIIVPVGYVMNGYYATQGGVYESAITMHPLMLGLFVAAPLMTFSQFAFLNHRKSCDFYHAIPHRRLTMFFSMMAAVLTWCAFLIVSGYGMALLCRLLFSGIVKFHIPWGTMLKYMLTLFAGCFCLTGLAGLAVSLTGTTFTNGLAFLLIGLAPRTIYNIVFGMMMDFLPFIEHNATNVLTNWGYNIPLGWLSGVFVGSSVVRTWQDWPAMGYTMLLGLVYMALAAWAFHRRKSERAGHAAVSPLMQAMFRMVLPLGISLSVTTSMIVEMKSDYGLGADVVFACLTLYIVAVVAYLLYELMTTKQWKAVGRSMPGLLILLGINVAAVLGINGWYHAQVGFQPKVGEIKKVEYLDQMYSTVFLEKHMHGMEMTDRELCDEIAAEITAQTQAWLESREAYYTYEDGGTEELSYKNWCVFKVTDRKGRTWIRKIWMNNKQMDRMMECVRQDASIQQKLKDLSGGKASSFYADWSDQSIDEDNGADALFALLQQEIQQMDFADWYQILTGNSEYTGLEIRAHIRFNVGDDYASGTNLYLTLPADKFPATYQAFVARVTDGAGMRQEELLKLLRNPEWDLSNVELDAYAAGDPSAGGRSEHWNRYYSDYKNDMPALRQHLIDCLTPAKGENFVEGGCILRISVEMYKRPDNENPAAGVTARATAPDKDLVNEEYIYETSMFFLTAEQFKTLRSKSFERDLAV